MTDQPTTPLPLPGASQRPPAWGDPATRRSVNRSLWVAVLMLLVAAAAAVGCVTLVRLGSLSEVWGLWVLVGAGGLGGGALAGGCAVLVLWGRTRRLLRHGAWVPGELTLDEGRSAELAYGRTLTRIALEFPASALGEPDDRIGVDVRSDGDQMLMSVPPSRRILRARPDPEGD